MGDPSIQWVLLLLHRCPRRRVRESTAPATMSTAAAAIAATHTLNRLPRPAGPAGVAPAPTYFGLGTPLGQPLLEDVAANLLRLRSTNVKDASHSRAPVEGQSVHDLTDLSPSQSSEVAVKVAYAGFDEACRVTVAAGLGGQGKRVATIGP